MLPSWDSSPIGNRQGDDHAPAALAPADLPLFTLDAGTALPAVGLGTFGLLGGPGVDAIAADHDVTPAQVVLRWHHQLSRLPVLRSSDPRRQAVDLDIATLTEGEAERISALGRPGSPRYGRLWGGDPATEER